jgi:hypothetical protein
MAVKKKIAKFNPKYRKGGDGFIQWCEENVHMPVYPEGSDIVQWVPMGNLPSAVNPETGRSYKSMWENQKTILRQALKMKDGEFVHRLIVFCWMRGEGKTALGPALINLWKFFNWPKQNIALAANSKDQTTVVTFEMVRDIILNSPKLLNLIGQKNIKATEIRLKDGRGNTVSIMRAVAVMASAILSGITGYAFSEVFQMKDPKRFAQLDGSIRNVPNAFGVIDSTVSPKEHFLYNLYKAWRDGKDKTLFFSYRCSKEADWRDYWHPHMTRAQLSGYRYKFPRWEFDMYFRNVWGAGSNRVFTEIEIEACRYAGADGVIGNQTKLLEVLGKISRAEELTKRVMEERDGTREVRSPAARVAEYRTRLRPLRDTYSLRDTYGKPRYATLEDLARLSDLYDTEWAIIGGIDRADPLKKEQSNAKTVMAFLAKGMVGSRSLNLAALGSAASYIYVLVHLVVITDSSMEWMKKEIVEIENEMDGIDMLSGERFGLFDLAPWCEDMNIPMTILYPNYPRQAEGFGELQRIVTEGRFKYPDCVVHGVRHDDLVEEEMMMFEHEMTSKKNGWFGSPEKFQVHGIQDDSIFAIGWAIYGSQYITADHFRKRTKTFFPGIVVEQQGLLGDYSVTTTSAS